MGQPRQRWREECSRAPGLQSYIEQVVLGSALQGQHVAHGTRT